MFEIAVKLENDESKFTKKSTCYEKDIVISRDDPKLEQFVKEARDEFKGQVNDISLIIRMVWE